MFPQTDVKPVLDSKQTVQTEIPIQIHPNTSHTDNQSEDGTCRQKWNKKSMSGVIILILLTFLPVATLIVGQLHKNDCPIQTWVPQWMTVFGAVGLATFSVLIFIGLITISCCSNNDREVGYGMGGCLLCLLIFFFLAWLIAGSVWVFSINTKVQFNETSLENYCSKSLYKFTFGTLLVQYTFIGLLICLGSCMGLLAICCG